jgi:hypothetical protein
MFLLFFSGESMAVTRTIAVIVYSPTQGRRRRVIIPEDDSQVALHARNILPGEAVLLARRPDCWQLGPDEVLARYLARPPADDRCVLADFTGRVVAELHADPKIDRHPDGKLYADPQHKAKIGDYVHRTGLLS